MEAEAKPLPQPGQQEAADSIVLEEEIDPNYVPSEAEVIEYAKWLGMDLEKDRDLFWIAREGLMAPLPKDWKPCRTKDTEDIYYFNFATGDSTWDHPCDGYYKRLYEEEKKKKEIASKESGDQKRTKAKADVEQLLGKGEKRKKKKRDSVALGDMDLVKSLPTPLGMDRKPLPGLAGMPLRGLGQSALPAVGESSSASVISSMDGPRISIRSAEEAGTKREASVERPSSSRGISEQAKAEAKSSLEREQQKLEREREQAGPGGLDPTAALGSKSRTLGQRREQEGAYSAISKDRAPLGGQRLQESERKEEVEDKPEAKGASAPYGAQPDDREERDSRDARDEREEREARDARDEREEREAREARVARNARDAREVREAREARELRDAREARADKEAKDARDERDARVAREGAREEREARVANEERGARVAKEERDARVAKEERDARVAKEERVSGEGRESHDSVHASSSSELRRLREEAADLQQRLDEAEARARRSKASLESAQEDLAQEDLLDAERRWKKEQRVMEQERDDLEGDLRKAKKAAADLADAPVLEGGEGERRAEKEAESLRAELRAAESGLARVVSAHSQLQGRLDQTEAQNSQQMRAVGEAEARSEHLRVEAQGARGEAAALQVQLEGLRKQLEDSQRAASVSASAPAVEAAAVEAEVEALRMRLSDEERLSSSLRASMLTIEQSLQRKADILAADKAALQVRLDEAARKAEAKGKEAEALRSSSLADREALGGLEAVSAQRQVLENSLAQLKQSEVALRQELAAQKEAAAQTQEQLLALQAQVAGEGKVNGEEAGEQVKRVLEQAAEARKALQVGVQAEAELHRIELQSLREEKDAMLVQLSQRDTALQFAKRELNVGAASAEALRRLEGEHALLAADLEKARVAAAQQLQQEVELRGNYESVLRGGQEQEQREAAAVRERDVLSRALEAEKVAAAQNEKKLKSYHEEVLQLQRTLSSAAGASADRGREQEQAASHLAREGAEGLTQLALKGEEVRAQAARADREAQRAGGLEQRLQQEQVRADDAQRELGELQTLLALKEDELQRAAKSSSARISLLESSAQLSGRARDDHSGALLDALQRCEDLEADKAAQGHQTRELMSQLSAAEASAEVQGITARRLEVESASYRDKWVASERTASELRAVDSRAVSLDLELEAARSELGAARSSADQKTAELQRLAVLHQREGGEQRGAVRALQLQVDSLQSQLAVAQAQMQTQAVPHLPVEADKENVAVGAQMQMQAQMQAQMAALSGISPNLMQPNVQQQQQLMELSLVVGQQQAAMVRMEEHIRRAEQMVRDLSERPAASAGMADKDRDSERESERVRDWDSERDRERELLASHTPDSMSLLPTRSTGPYVPYSDSSASPMLESPRPPAKRDRGKRSVQFQSTVPTHADSTRAHASASAKVLDSRRQDPGRIFEPENMLAWENVQKLVRRHDLHLHESATLREGLVGASVLRSAASRVFAESKARVKRETRFLRELQALCAAGKKSIAHDQACVKKLKAVWRSQAGVGKQLLSTHSINAVTVRVNAAVDALRQAQELAQSREKRLRSLSQSARYLEQLLETDQGQGQGGGQHMAELVALVQQKCKDSAREFSALAKQPREVREEAGEGFAVYDDALDSSPGPRPSSAPPAPQAHAFAEAPVGFYPGGFPGGFPPQAYFPGGGQAFPFAGPGAYSAYSMAAGGSPSRPGAAALVSSSATFGLSSIRSAEVKTRILQEEISKIAARQSQSKDVFELHAGWLDSLKREVGEVHAHSHVGGKPVPSKSVPKGPSSRSALTWMTPPEAQGNAASLLAPTDFAI